MPKDYAGRTRPRKKKPATRKRRNAKANPRVFFHGPSFIVGAIVGAAIVILTAYAPELLQNAGQGEAAPKATEAVTPQVQFEFQEMLKESEVEADPEPYAVPEKISRPQSSLRIQAASFRAQADADRLRADLLLQNLPASTTANDVNGVTWYRVVVGPYERKVDANRAMTQLRAQDLSAIWLNDDN